MSQMIRYAILTAVSSAQQATTDKISLEYQQTNARSVAMSYGWRESAGPFVVNGYSRSNYTNLSDAEKDIPPIHAALSAMRNGLFDVLVVYSYDRLGDLTILISNELRKYKVQLYSISQPSVVQDPTQYDPYTNESSDTQQDVARIVQRFRINDLRRKWRAGVPARLARGLNPLRVPFGYQWVGRNVPPVVNEVQAALIIKMRDWLFAGVSIKQIARRCDETKIRTANGKAHWNVNTIVYILANPFYSGKTVLFRAAGVYDPSRKIKKRMVPRPRSTWLFGEGAHKPLWDEATANAILRELERRKQQNIRKSVRFPLSGILTCAACGSKLHRRNHGTANQRHNVIVCKKSPKHFTHEYDWVVDCVGRSLRDRLLAHRFEPLPAPENKRDDYQARLDELALRRARIQAGYENDLYTAAEAAEKLNAVNIAVEAVKAQIEENTRMLENSAMLKSAVNSPTLDDLPEWIASDDPALVNRIISALCKKIDLTNDGQVQIHFR